MLYGALHRTECPGSLSTTSNRMRGTTQFIGKGRQIPRGILPHFPKLKEAGKQTWQGSEEEGEVARQRRKEIGQITNEFEILRSRPFYIHGIHVRKSRIAG